MKIQIGSKRPFIYDCYIDANGNIVIEELASYGIEQVTCGMNRNYDARYYLQDTQGQSWIVDKVELPKDGSRGTVTLRRGTSRGRAKHMKIID